MKMRSIMLNAGSILLWKDYRIIRRWWSKLTNKKLKYNRYTIISQKTELLTSDNINNMAIYEPIKKYSKLESGKLNILTYGFVYSKDWKEIVALVNMVRSNTLQESNTIDTSKYYKRVSYAESNEYIY